MYIQCPFTVICLDSNGFYGLPKTVERKKKLRILLVYKKIYGTVLDS